MEIKKYKYECRACQDTCDPDEYFGICVFISPVPVDDVELVCPVSAEECEWQEAEE